MDEHMLFKYKERGIPIKDSYLAKVNAVFEDPRYSSWTKVLRAMLQHHVRLEQESVFEYDDLPYMIP
jgi:DNA topoisomerase VI subunit A